MRHDSLHRPWLAKAAALAEQFLDSLPERPVRGAPFEEVRRGVPDHLPDDPTDPTVVVEDLARAAEPGLVASAGPRYFGFVIGGSLPAALAADWMTSAWDQNAALAISSPAAAAVEDVAVRWILDLLDLPRDATVGLVTGCQMANFTCLAAARHAVLARAGWDVEEDGLSGAPAVDVITSAESHATIFSSLRLLGLGSRRARRLPVDEQGRMRADALEEALRATTGPAIVCAQAGNVNTGAFDPLEEIAALARERGAWLHVDGAFGLWAAASPEKRHLVRGAASADSWATDAHKWLNVPYDCGIAVVRDASAHRAAMRKSAAYLIAAPTARDNHDVTPESSRRARGFAVYAALRSLGRRGLAELVERDCRLAARMADRLRQEPGARILNEVVLNQVLVRFEPPMGADDDAFTAAVVARVQKEGTCWFGTTRWMGRPAARISVSGWSTDEGDIDRSARAITEALRAERAAAG